MRLASPPTTARQRADDLGGKTVDQRQQRVLGAAGEAGVVVGSFLAWLMRSTKSRAKGVVTPDWGTAFLSPEWMLAKLCPAWRVLEFAPGRNQENQDVYVLQRV